ncbi:MAG: hypothetical protein WAW52_14180, partial [Methanothrix sp.]
TGCMHVISLASEEKDRFVGSLQDKEGEEARQAEIDRQAKKHKETHPPEQKKRLRKWLRI